MCVTGTPDLPHTPRQAHPVQNSPGTSSSGAQPVQNSPSSHPWQAIPVQNSPGSPQNADIGPFSACRENFIPLAPPTGRAGRTLYRTQGQFRYKTLPAYTPAGNTGTKLSQRAPKRRFRPTFRMQGELCTASATNNPSREKKVTHQHPASPQQHTPPPISHVIRLHETSTTLRNVEIPTTTIQILKHSHGNYVRN